MKKLLPLFSLLLMLGCEEPEGPAGPAGEDGIENIHIEIIEMTVNNTSYVCTNTDTIYFNYTFESPLVTQAVIDSGLVVVEMSPSTLYDWVPLPLVFYDGDTSDVNFIYDAFYHYSVGNVTIMWSCSFCSCLKLYQLGVMWMANYCKISIITPN
jgi:hypothetical protein